MRRLALIPARSAALITGEWREAFLLADSRVLAEGFMAAVSTAGAAAFMAVADTGNSAQLEKRI